MAKDYLVNIDLNKNSLLQAVIEVLASAPGSPTEGQVYYNSTDETIYVRTGSTWLDLGVQGGAGATNLSFSRDGTTVTISSSTGDNAIILAATGALAGVMSAADKDKLDNIEASADVTDATNVDAAGATMNSDTNVSANGWVLDQDNMSSDDNTKVPTQQSVKAYVDNIIAGLTALESTDIDTLAEINAIIGDATLISEEVTDTTNFDFVIDEDNMVSDLATKVPTQQSVKAYVDNNTLTKFSETIGNGAATTIVSTHNIGSRNCTAQVFETASPYAQVECDIEMDTINATSFTFNVAPSTNEFTVIIIG